MKSKKNMSRHTQTPKSWKTGSKPKHSNMSAKHQRIKSKKKNNKNKEKADINALNLTSSKKSATHSTATQSTTTHSIVTQSTATQSTMDVRTDPNNKTFGHPEKKSSLIGPADTKSTGIIRSHSQNYQCPKPESTAIAYKSAESINSQSTDLQSTTNIGPNSKENKTFDRSETESTVIKLAESTVNNCSNSGNFQNLETKSTVTRSTAAEETPTGSTETKSTVTQFRANQPKASETTAAQSTINFLSQCNKNSKPCQYDVESTVIQPVASEPTVNMWPQCQPLRRSEPESTVADSKSTRSTATPLKATQSTATHLTASQSTVDLQKISAETAAINEIISPTDQCGDKTLVNGEILDRKLEILIDTGSQINAISSSCIPTEIIGKLGKSDLNIQSFTGNKVDIMGKFSTDIQMGTLNLKNCVFHVINGKCRTILGTSTLRSNDLQIHIKAGKIYNEEGSCPIVAAQLCKAEMNFVDLKIQKCHDGPALMMSNENFKLAPLSTKFIKVRSRYPISTPAYYAVTQPFSDSLPFGVILGKSLAILSPDQTECVVRICNTNNTEIEIQKQTRIVTLDEVSLVTQDKSKASYDSTQKLRAVMKDIHIGSTDPIMRKRLLSVIKQNLDAFATDDEKLGTTNVVKYDIDTGSSAPVAQQRYRCPYYLRDELQRIITKNVDNGLMEPCTSPWAAPVLLVRKKNGTWRLVCDYRKLNAVTTSDCYPLPRIDDLITNLSKSSVFSAADLWTGFHQIPCSEAAKEKLAITTEFGQFTWKNMPMGGKNAPSVFQRLMDQIFRTIPRSQLVVYLDDLLCHSETEAENINQLEQILSILVKNNLKIRAKKTEFLVKSIKFCGFVIEKKQRKANPEKVEAIRDLKTPTNKQAAQQIYGLLNYHRSFIQHFAQKAAPITKAYRKKFEWTEAASEALETLKNEICNKALSLRIPDPQISDFVVETDASNYGIGACLFICERNKADKQAHKHTRSCLQPVEYLSKMLNSAQINYSTMEKELLAAKEAFQKWSHFLLGRQFTWLTDNAALAWAHKLRGRKLKISQWLSEISEFDIIIQRQGSSAMKISDCLSRNFAEVNSLKISRKNLADLQEDDELLNNIRRYVRNDRWPNKPNSRELPFARIRNKLHLESNGELVVSEFDTTKIVPPRALWDDLLTAFHDRNGHPGEKVTLDQLQQKYFWPGLVSMVKNHIRTCHDCQSSKPNLRPKKAPQGESETPFGPWEILAWDLIGPLATTDQENKYILTGIDLFSKKAYAHAIQSKHSEKITELIENELLRNPCMPKKLLTDNGLEFADLKDLCQRYKITLVKSPPYHPQTNGAVERLNQTLKNRLFSSDSDNWDLRLPRMVHCINCAIHAVTKTSPFMLENGHRGSNPADPISHSHERCHNIQRIEENVRNKILAEKEERKNKFRNDNFSPFCAGDLVLTKNMTSKFPRFLGPFTIARPRGPQLSYEIINQAGQTFIRHVSQLKPYFERQTQSSEENTPEVENPANGKSSAHDEMSEQTWSDEVLFQGPVIFKRLEKASCSSSHSNKNGASKTSNLAETTVYAQPRFENIVKRSEKQLLITESTVNIQSQPENNQISQQSEPESTVMESEGTQSTTNIRSKVDNAHILQRLRARATSTRPTLTESTVDTQSRTENIQQSPQSEESFLTEASANQSTITESTNTESTVNMQSRSGDYFTFPLAEPVPFVASTTSRNEQSSSTASTVEGNVMFSSDSSEVSSTSSNSDGQDQVEPRMTLRDRGNLQTPKRPLDENFAFSPARSSTPIDTDDETFSTPKGPDPQNLLNSSIHRKNNSTHDCPITSNKYGRRVPLSKLSDDELCQIASNNGIDEHQKPSALLKAVDSFYKKHHPTWPRNEKGVLVFTINFVIPKPTPLSAFTKAELVRIYQHFHLTVSLMTSKKLLLEKLDQKLTDLFPTCNRYSDKSCILTVEMLESDKPSTQN